MATVKFYRGKESGYAYNGTTLLTHKDGIYFATDTQKIFINGVSYGGRDLSDDILKLAASAEFSTENGKNQLILKNLAGSRLGDPVILDLLLPDQYYEFENKTSAEAANNLKKGYHVLIEGDGLYIVTKVEVTADASGTTYLNSLLKLVKADELDAALERINTLESEVSGIKTTQSEHNSRISTLENKIQGLSGAMHFIGISTTDPSSSNGPSVEGVISYSKGDVVIFESKEYVYNGTSWEEFGDTSELSNKVSTLEGNFTDLSNELGDPAVVQDGVITKEATGVYKVINQSIDEAMVWFEVEG